MLFSSGSTSARRAHVAQVLPAPCVGNLVGANLKANGGSEVLRKLGGQLTVSASNINSQVFGRSDRGSGILASLLKEFGAMKKSQFPEVPLAIRFATSGGRDASDGCMP